MSEAPSAYQVLAFSRSSLFLALESAECSAAAVADSQRANYLAGYLDRLGAATLVVEYDYIDGDYLEDFASYYVRCFHNYNRRCKRVHVFSCEFSDAHFRDAVLSGEHGKWRLALQAAYLGFIVARPLPESFIGRTVLKHYEEDRGRRQYTVVRDYSVVLFGLRLHIRSLAFQEQDTVLAACATVALWSAFQKTADLFGTPAPRPAEITRMASGVWIQGRAIPSHGLGVVQVAQAVRGVGLEPEIIESKSGVPLVSAAYSYLRAGLPVILVGEGKPNELHAVTLVGYSMRGQRLFAKEGDRKSSAPPMRGLRIDEFYCHDDQVGPFAGLFVGANKEEKLVLSAKEEDLPLVPKYLLVPVYNKIRVTFLEVLVWVERLWSLVSYRKMAKDFEWDIHLTTTNDYKSELATRPQSNPVSRQMLLEQQPRFIWCVRLSHKRRVVLELLGDATDMERSFPFFKVIWHHSGFAVLLRELLASPAAPELLTNRLHQFLVERRP